MGFYVKDNLIIIIFIVFFIINVVISLIYRSKKNKKLLSIKENEKTMSIDDIVKNNQFIANNREKYEKIMDQNALSLQGERKKTCFFIVLEIIVMFVILASLFLLKNKIGLLFIIIIPVSIIGIGIIATKSTGAYSSQNEENFNNVVRNILKDLDSNFEYYPQNGYKYEEYSKLIFGEPCDRFYSNDMIINLRNGFNYADILVKSREEDDDGHTYYETQFDGTLARMDINNVNCNIILGGLGENSFFKDELYKNIKFENDEFNKLFVCFASNELNAYKVLTPDVMEEFVNIKRNSLGDIDIRIFNDKLYIRFKGTNGFDSTILNKKVEKENLFKSIAILDQVIKTMNKVKIIIDNKNMN